MVNFNNEDLNPILPFGEDNPLDKKVQSDHCELAIMIPPTQESCGFRTINVWNISNPAYHGYFQYGDQPPFHHTHLFVDKPYQEGKLDERLTTKIEEQVNTIAQRFANRTIHIQVIVEGYEDFYDLLAQKLQELGAKDYMIVNLLKDKPADWKKEWNVTGILVNTVCYQVLESDVVRGKYCEEQDSNKEKDFQMPYVKVEDRLSHHQFYVLGVHINECASQYPKSGLELLSKEIMKLWLKGQKKADVLALGDYNTAPKNSQISVLGELEGDKELLTTPYPTHVNPSSLAGIYDQASLLRAEGSPWKYVVLTLDGISDASKALVKSIQTSRENYESKLT